MHTHVRTLKSDISFLPVKTCKACSRRSSKNGHKVNSMIWVLQYFTLERFMDCSTAQITWIGSKLLINRVVSPTERTGVAKAYWIFSYVENPRAPETR